MLLAVLATRPGGQSAASLSSLAATRLAILAAEDRRAPTAGDLATIRAGVHSGDATTVRIALRALGRLERPDLIADIVPALRHSLPEVRAEAATAIGQAAQGWTHRPPSKAPAGADVDAASAALAARLSVEADASVRAVIAESLGRLPYVTGDQVEKAGRTLLGLLARSQSAPDRLGVARGLEAIARLHPGPRPMDAAVVGTLRTLATLSLPPSAVDLDARVTRRLPAGIASDPARDARVRRVALQALIDAEAADDAVIRGAVADPDAQMRRLAMRAASNPAAGSSAVAADVLRQGLADPSAMVRLEAIMALPAHDLEAGPGTGAHLNGCEAAMGAVGDPDLHVALAGLDRLAPCSSDDAVAILEDAVEDLSQAGSARGWHRAAHGIVALASASPERAAAAMPALADSRIGHLRIYAARAAAILHDRSTLERLATDDDDNVKEAAIDGLRVVAGHGADGFYIGALAAGGYQVLRSAAVALAGSPDAAPALSAALHRLVVEGHDNSRDVRRAIAETLRGLGVAAETATPVRAAGAAPALGPADLRRLASARARVTIRGVGTFEMALIASEAPLSALRFVRLVRSGYYNGLTFHRVVPNFVIQGGSPGANEYVGDATFMRDELGQWPHVRGAVGISTRGRDTGDAQIFVDLVDNPRLDHDYTVFAHVLNGMEIVDAILEGDVIERIDIIGGP
jgi:peptidyl-prolyl cis-trans isomerase B (cyclophilin B)